MVNLLIVFLLLNPLPEPDQDRPVEVDLTLMYRRSGGTVKQNPRLQSGDTVHYYKRWMNPYFRVYTFKFKASMTINNMEVSSYLSDSLLNNAQLKPRNANSRMQFVDTFVEPKEDLVKLTVHYTTPDNQAVSNFVLFIKPDLEHYPTD